MSIRALSSDLQMSSCPSESDLDPEGGGHDSISSSACSSRKDPLLYMQPGWKSLGKTKKKKKVKNMRYVKFRKDLKIKPGGTSLVVQWLGIDLPIQGTWARSLVQEDPTCCGTAKPMHHNYWACALEPTRRSYWSHHNEKPMTTAKGSPAHRNRRKRTHSNGDPAQPKAEKKVTLEIVVILLLFCTSEQWKIPLG